MGDFNSQTELPSHGEDGEAKKTGQLQPSQQPLPLHQSDVGDDDDNVKQLGQCSSLYISLQDCLVNNNRNWKACQEEVQALRACSERRNKYKGK
ncbi:hypothetical protein K2173_017592 [Erythroxylum novogranatense]|uniref:Uncharacterized protein n=1 Tax=Erythroxylum novogranatense TaxID=1862640 RepID=A0AAV8TNS6_9ROSI|nr:hypothetical protein K2173_017592 [Erythroxylum novogranatense]